MAESAQRGKAGGAAARKSPVQRTTTETMRLEATATGAQQQAPAPNRKKTSSFQITSVTVGARASNDAGEDSNDDLDESHTEDNSRITDLETPSYSEDTFSKEDVFFNAGNAALSTAPVIPTSSQYGLAIVPSEATGPTNSTNDANINDLDIANVTDNNIINLLAANNKQDTDLREVHSHGRNERFKVVKIESTEPFKRGRWTCMDYLDHTSVNQQTAISTPKVSDPNEVCISYGVTDSGIVISDSIKQSLISDSDKGTTIGSLDSNGQVSHQELLNAQQMSASSGSGASSASSYVPSSLPNAAPPNTGQQPPPTQQQQQPSSQIPQYFTAPSSQAQSQSQGQAQQATSIPASLAQGTIPLLVQSNSGALAKDDSYSTTTTMNLQGQPQGASAGSQPSMIVQTGQSELPGTIPGIQSIHKVPQTAAPTGAPLQSQVIGGATGNQTAVQMPPQPQVSANVIGSIQQQAQQTQQSQQQPQQQQSGVAAFLQPDAEQDSIAAGILVKADAALLESLAEVTQTGEEPNTLEDNERMSGTSAVAIDNKIEQAMDLVKSHLMFAVREEVEVLKEKIAELMDRINQLEAENSQLKAHVTPETLAQLSQAAKLSLNNSGSGQ